MYVISRVHFAPQNVNHTSLIVRLARVTRDSKPSVSRIGCGKSERREGRSSLCALEHPLPSPTHPLQPQYKILQKQVFVYLKTLAIVLTVDYVLGTAEARYIILLVGSGRAGLARTPSDRYGPSERTKVRIHVASLKSEGRNFFCITARDAPL